MLTVLSKGEPLPLQNHTIRDEPGIHVAFFGGDVYDPQNGNWFEPPWPTIVFKYRVRWRILPFINWNVRGMKGYLGWKPYGVDDARYLNWIPAAHVKDGSVALCLTARLRAKDHE